MSGLEILDSEKQRTVSNPSAREYLINQRKYCVPNMGESSAQEIRELSIYLANR